MRVQFDTEAREELRQASRWYEGKQRGLGGIFRQEVSASVERLKRYPLMGHSASGDIRAVYVRRFPFAVHYRVREDSIVVIGITHMSRDDDAWTQRQGE